MKPGTGSAMVNSADRLQFAVAAALDRFEAVKFEAHDAVDDRHLFEPVAKIRGHLVPLSIAPALARASPVRRARWAGIADRAATDKVGAVHLPDRDPAIVVLPHDVGMAVVVKIASALDVPSSVRDCRPRRRR